MCLNTASIAKRKSNWIDFNAGELIESNDFENMTEEIFKLLIDIASGRQTKNEQNGYLEEYERWLSSPDFDEKTKKELEKIKNDEKGTNGHA